ncbi:MAG: hypothetical protein KTR17_07600, partial [Cellvibrionaceae bacterium]|nr:hypothetical protein [Cellvibrionaceae bacterium]
MLTFLNLSSETYIGAKFWNLLHAPPLLKKYLANAVPHMSYFFKSTSATRPLANCSACAIDSGW